MHLCRFDFKTRKDLSHFIIIITFSIEARTKNDSVLLNFYFKTDTHILEPGQAPKLGLAYIKSKHRIETQYTGRV